MKNKQQFLMYAIAFMLIAVAAASRLLPHPNNMTPIAAIALFGGIYFDKKFALIVPLAAMAISDYFLGFSDVFLFVYASFVLVGVIGMWAKSRKSVLTILGSTLAGSVLFFLLTNFGVWYVQMEWYARSWEGIVACYVAAIPFFRNTLVGDVVYVTGLFGLYELSLVTLKKYYAKRQAVKD
jgi:hypothetical protein